MPADQSEERKSAMAAFGAELISVPSSSDGGGMEAARDLAAIMQVSPRLQGRALQPILSAGDTQVDTRTTYTSAVAHVCCASGWVLPFKGFCSFSVTISLLG